MGGATGERVASLWVPDSKAAHQELRLQSHAHQPSLCRSMTMSGGQTPCQKYWPTLVKLMQASPFLVVAKL